MKFSLLTKLRNGLRNNVQPNVFDDIGEKSPLVCVIERKMYPNASSSLGKVEKSIKYNFIESEMHEISIKKMIIRDLFKNSPIPKNKFFNYTQT